ncbi:fibronectin type III domain-containing protein [Dyadobacter psychrotolerans]|uniref:Fibronectin type-III domain-containing protein n=1 Tax=Dyadobacter psychrotolerans TaxID=2541721 RepID=A0A4R5DFA5_9BACT|nr:hypothetical protein [Dyadobacter psychrotolerans]TDE10561.1 hypothetical protein E0F88_28175 [Dyadobacter psychrotolerans]
MKIFYKSVLSSTLVLLLSILLTGGICLGQQADDISKRPQPRIDTSLTGRYRVGIMAKAFGDSVVVRWAPNHAALFRQALKQGYLLTRRSLTPDKKMHLDYQITVKPWTTAEWLKNVSAKDTLAAASAQLVNGTNTPIGANDAITLDKILDQQNQNDLRMMIALLLADVSPRNATGMALGWVDKNVKKGVRYSYYLTPLTNPELYPVEMAVTSVTNEKETEAQRMTPVKVTSGEHLIRLSWNRLLSENLFSCYYVQRSDDGGKTFRRITKRPWIQAPTSVLDDKIEYTDSVKQNYRPYQYRVLGITPFGELVASEIVSGSAVDRTAPHAVEDLKATHLQGSNVKLTWKYNDRPADLAGFVVAKGMNLDGPFTPLTSQPLGAAALDFVDTTALPHLPNYYRVVAIDTASNIGLGLPAYCVIKDSKGPSKPMGVQGYIDTTGFVRLVWDMNREPDLLGYRVISANAPDHVFTGDTRGYLALPVFNDSTTLQTLTRKKYFRVIAYDKSYNPSEPSDIFELKRPDLLKPVAPVIQNYTVSDTAVVISWSPSSSADVSNQILMRRGKNTERWVELAKLENSVSNFADKTIKGHSEYGYALVAVDEAGLRSDVSFPLNVKTPRITPASVNGLKAFLNPDKSVSLYWTYNIPNCRFVIYKALKNEGFASYDSIYDTREYRDKRPQKGLTQYAVRVIYQDGMESGLSKIIEVDVK